MPKRLVGILVCILLANILNFALGRWLTEKTAEWAPPVAVADGSTLNTSRYFQERADTTLAGSPDAEALLDFYTWLDRGGSDAYLTWEASRRDLRAASTPFLQRALTVAESSNAGRYLSLLLLIITILLLWGRGLREQYFLTPFLYLGICTGTAALFGSLSSPMFTALIAGWLILYFGGLRLFLPIWHVEWSRLMRPSLTLCIFLLAAMSLRGPELVDFWFWTSPLFRLALVLVLLLTIFFHLTILVKVLETAKMDSLARLFAFGMPLGVATLILGVFLGYYGPVGGAAIQQLNYELVTLAPQTVAGFNPDAPFILAFAGIILLVFSGIGYYVQRIAR